MSAPTAAELRALAHEILPVWFFEEERSEEEIYAFAEIAEDAADLIDFWLSQTRILEAVGATGTEPDWLNQHAIDRGTRRREGETTPVLRQRIRNVPDMLTRPTLLDAAQEIVEAQGVTGTVAMVELRRDKAYIGSFTAVSGTGGIFAGTAPDMNFTPTVLPWPRPPYLGNFPPFGYRILFSGALNADNDGTFTTTGMLGNAVKYTNATGVAQSDPVVLWAAQKLDQDGNVADNFTRAYVGRGYRVGRGAKTMIIIMILPYGTTAATAAAVEEMLRQKKGGGVTHIVERRLIP